MSTRPPNLSTPPDGESTADRPERRFVASEGAELIRLGSVDAVLAGGAEASMNPLMLAGFTAMSGLAIENENPPRASRPTRKSIAPRQMARMVLRGGHRSRSSRRRR